MEELGAGPDLSPVRVNFSATLSTAVALLTGHLTPAELEPDWLGPNEGAVRDLASRVTLRHDPSLTAKTLLGTLQAGASPDLGLGDLLRIRRRLGDLNMDGANPAPALIQAIGRDRDLRRALSGSLLGRLRRCSTNAIGGLDVPRLRMTFPSRMRIRLRDGTTGRSMAPSLAPAVALSKSNERSSRRSARSLGSPPRRRSAEQLSRIAPSEKQTRRSSFIRKFLI